MKKISTRTLTQLAMFIAVSIILARLLAFYITPSLRFSFEYFPIILAGICFGPFAGAVVGGLSDFIGATLLSGLGYYPPLAVGPILAGLIAGLVAKYVFRNDLSRLWRVAVVVVAAEIPAVLLWGTYALSLLYHTPFLTFLAIRAPFKAIIMIIDSILVIVVYWALRPLLKKNGRL